jgi:hypothetical protein
MANALHPKNTIEVGCGLGEIVSRIEGRRRLGFDVDDAVIAAACHLYGPASEFFVAGIADFEAIACASLGAADLLIMVNWPHGLAWDKFSAHVLKIVRMLSVQHVLMDTILPEISGYAYHHTIEDLRTLGEVVLTRLASDQVRQLHVIRIGT